MSCSPDIANAAPFHAIVDGESRNEGTHPSQEGLGPPVVPKACTGDARVVPGFVGSWMSSRCSGEQTP